jgi:ABC-type multidrug transport system permease subunit
VPGFVAPMIMFSGILYERQSVPVWLAWLERISLVNYAFGSLLAQQIHILPQSWAKYLLLFTQVRPHRLSFLCCVG